MNSFFLFFNIPLSKPIVSYTLSLPPKLFFLHTNLNMIFFVFFKETNEQTNKQTTTTKKSNPILLSSSICFNLKEKINKFYFHFHFPFCVVSIKFHWFATTHLFLSLQHEASQPLYHLKKLEKTKNEKQKEKIKIYPRANRQPLPQPPTNFLYSFNAGDKEEQL